MNRILLLIVLCVLSSNALALKYMCQKAVRGNSGKYNAISSSLHSYTASGELAANKQGLLDQIDNAIQAIEKAGCPLDDPQVSKVLDPLKQLRLDVDSAQAQTAVAATAQPASAATSVPAVAATLPAQAQKQPQPAGALPEKAASASASGAGAKLSYSCRQVMHRQSGKPKEMHKALDFYRQAVAQGKTVRAVPGLELDAKIKASLTDLESGACPVDHPQVSEVVTQLKSQLEEIPVLYASLKERLDQRAETADPENYPDFEKDFAFFKYLDEKYIGIDSMYDANMKPGWRTIPNQKNSAGLMAVGINVKKPVYKYDALKDILANMRTDGEKYNREMPAFEAKYKELLRFNQSLGQLYVRTRDSAAAKMKKLYTVHYDWLSNNLPAAIETNLRVLKELEEKAVAEKKPHYFRGAVIPDVTASNDQMIELYGYLSDSKKAEADAYKQQQNEVLKKIRTAQDSLADVMLEEMRLPAEKYQGNDLEKIRRAIHEKAQENFSGRELLKVIVSSKDWKVTDYVSWSNSSAFHHNYSELGARVVVRENDEVAKIISTIYKVDHKQRDKVSIWFTETDENDVYQNPRILISNM